MSRGVALFFTLFNNLAIFMALVTFYHYLIRKYYRLFRVKRQALAGISFATVAILPGFLLVNDLQTGWQRLKAMAMLDGLTGIANRRRFDQTPEREWYRARRTAGCLSLVMIDIDEFKGMPCP